MILNVYLHLHRFSQVSKNKIWPATSTVQPTFTLVFLLRTVENLHLNLPASWASKCHRIGWTISWLDKIGSEDFWRGTLHCLSANQSQRLWPAHRLSTRTIPTCFSTTLRRFCIEKRFNHKTSGTWMKLEWPLSCPQKRFWLERAKSKSGPSFPVKEAPLLPSPWPFLL